MSNKSRPKVMWEIIREVAETESTWHNDNDGCEYCPYCRNFLTQHQWLIESKEFEHETDCIVARARALVAEIDKGKE
jgi:hypothetical protein